MGAAAVIAAIAVGAQSILAEPAPPVQTEPPAPQPTVSTTTQPTSKPSSSPTPTQSPSLEPSAVPLTTPTLPPVTATVPGAVTNDEQPNPSGDDWHFVDCQDPCVERIVEIDERVVDMVSDGPSAFYAHPGAWILTENAIIEYDAGTLLTRIEIPNYSGEPTSITASRNYLYVAAGSHLFRITPELEVQSGCPGCSQGERLRELAFGGGYLWASYMNEAGGGVSRFSETGANSSAYWYEELAPIAVLDPSAIAVSGRYAWVVSGTALRKIEVETAQLAGGIETGVAGPRPLIAVGTSIWTQLSGHTVEVVSATGRVKAAYPVLGLLKADASYVDAEGRRDFMLVTDPDERTLYRIDAGLGEIEHALLIEAAPQVVADGGSWSLFAENGDGSSKVIQIHTGH